MNPSNINRPTINPTLIVAEATITLLSIRVRMAANANITKEKNARRISLGFMPLLFAAKAFGGGGIGFADSKTDYAFCECVAAIMLG